MSDIFEPISIKIDDITINALNDKGIKEYKVNIEKYPWGLFEDFVCGVLYGLLHSILEILTKESYKIMFVDSSFCIPKRTHKSIKRISSERVRERKIL